MILCREWHAALHVNRVDEWVSSLPFSILHVKGRYAAYAHSLRAHRSARNFYLRRSRTRFKKRQ